MRACSIVQPEMGHTGISGFMRAGQYATAHHPRIVPHAPSAPASSWPPACMPEDRNDAAVDTPEVGNAIGGSDRISGLMGFRLGEKEGRGKNSPGPSFFFEFRFGHQDWEAEPG
jgi:hypothetical protein